MYKHKTEALDARKHSIRRSIPHFLTTTADLVQRSERLLDRNTKPTNTENGPQPLVGKLLHAWPKSILVRAELLQLGKFVWLGSRVATHLVRLLLLVTTEEAEEAVVRDRAEELNWGEHVAAIEHDDEGNVDEGVAEVAGFC